MTSSRSCAYPSKLCTRLEGWLTYHLSRSQTLMIGGVSDIASAMHAFWEAREDRGIPT